MVNILLWLILGFVFAAGVQAGESNNPYCPKAMSSDATDGWRVVNIESALLRRKPHLREVVKKSIASVVSDEGKTESQGPYTVMHEAIRLSDNRVIRTFDIRGPDGKIYPGIVLACFYAGDSYKFLVKPPPAGSIKCNTFVDAAGNDEMRFVCTSTQ
jgi:hypothetical protein